MFFTNQTAHQTNVISQPFSFLSQHIRLAIGILLIGASATVTDLGSMGDKLALNQLSLNNISIGQPVRLPIAASGDAPAVSTPLATQVAQTEAKVQALKAAEQNLGNLDVSHDVSDAIIGGIAGLGVILGASIAAAGLMMRRRKQRLSQLAYPRQSRVMPTYEALFPEAQWQVTKQAQVDGFIALATEVVELPKTVPAVGNLEVAAEQEAEVNAGNSEQEFFSSLRTELPLCRVEEIVDETAEAKFWMDLNEPQRAIEILEKRWKYAEPNTPLPLLYLLDLYQLTGEKQKYKRLTIRFEHTFNGKVATWVEAESVKDQMPKAMVA